MPGTYCKTQCRHCPQKVSTNGMGRTSHARKHVREGVLVAVTPTVLPLSQQRVRFVTPEQARQMITDEPLSMWEVVEGTLTI